MPRNQALGVSLLSAYSCLSMALGLAQMVLDVKRRFKTNPVLHAEHLLFQQLCLA